MALTTAIAQSVELIGAPWNLMSEQKNMRSDRDYYMHTSLQISRLPAATMNTQQKWSPEYSQLATQQNPTQLPIRPFF